MTSADARWLLAQPESLRRALADVPGPGWECFDRPVPICTVKAAPHYRFDEMTGTGYAWAPCDPLAIVESVCCTRCGAGLHRTGRAGSEWRASTDLQSAYGPTAFRAAVALMAASLGIEMAEVDDG